MGRDHSGPVRRREEPGPLEGRVHDCHQSTKRRAPGARQPARNLRYEPQLGEGPLGFTMRILIAATFTLVSVAIGQSPLAPVQPKRLPPEKGKANAKAYIDQYDFGGQLLAL